MSFDFPDTVAKWQKVELGADGSFSCNAFVDASYALIKIFDCLNGMGTVKKDMLGNADKICVHMKATPGLTLQEMITKEVTEGFKGDATKAAKKSDSITCATLWLKRALRLVVGMLKHLLEDPSLSLKDCVKKGYEEGLRAHHNMVTAGVVKGAMSMCPSRATFMEKLGGSEADKEENLKTLVPMLTECICSKLHTFLLDHQIETK